MNKINTHCEATTDGKHSFYSFSIVDPPEFPFRARSFHTCVTCGHRRALDVTGVLWWFDADAKTWNEKHDTEGVIE